MLIIFVFVSFVVAILVFLMFLILKKTVRIVNEQTKSYFVNKLQGYDDIIREKENKLQEIEDLLKDKKNGINKENNSNKLGDSYAFDTNVIDLLNSTKYQDKNIFELNKKIDEKFVVNYEELVKDFLTLCDDSNDYEFCLKLRNRFDSEKIYEFKSILPEERDNKLKEFLSDREYKVYEAFKTIISEHTIENLIDYLDQIVNLNNPKVTILVGNKSENYDHLSDYIETIYNDKIYRGIKIIYKNKVYDFSLSERNI